MNKITQADKKFIKEKNKLRNELHAPILKLQKEIIGVNEEISKLRTETPNSIIEAEKQKSQITSLSKKLVKLQASLNTALKKESKEYSKRVIELENERDEFNQKVATNKLFLEYKDISDKELKQKEDNLSKFKKLNTEQTIELNAIKQQQEARKISKDRKQSKNDDEVDKLLLKLEKSQFLKFIQHPSKVVGDAVKQTVKNSFIGKGFESTKEKLGNTKLVQGANKLNQKLGVTKQALGIFFKDSTMGKVAGFLMKPISQGMSNALTKFFPYKNIVDFLLSPAGITMIMALVSLFKNLIWRPILKPIWTNIIKPTIDAIKTAITWIKDAYNSAVEKTTVLFTFLMGDVSMGEKSLLGWFNVKLVEPLKKMWNWIKGMGAVIKNLGAIIGSKILNKIIHIINDKFIGVLRDVDIMGYTPFAKLSDIPTVRTPPLSPEAAKFLGGAADVTMRAVNSANSKLAKHGLSTVGVSDKVNKYIETKNKVIQESAKRANERRKEEKEEEADRNNKILQEVQAFKSSTPDYMSVTNNTNNASMTNISVDERHLNEPEINLSDFTLTPSFGALATGY